MKEAILIAFHVVACYDGMFYEIVPGAKLSVVNVSQCGQPPL